VCNVVLRRHADVARGAPGALHADNARQASKLGHPAARGADRRALGQGGVCCWLTGWLLLLLLLLRGQRRELLSRRLLLLLPTTAATPAAAAATPATPAATNPAPAATTATTTATTAAAAAAAGCWWRVCCCWRHRLCCVACWRSSRLSSASPAAALLLTTLLNLARVLCKVGGHGLVHITRRRLLVLALARVVRVAVAAAAPSLAVYPRKQHRFEVSEARGVCNRSLSKGGVELLRLPQRARRRCFCV
jgi:pyruvate/2-oxoglutarate dehydrogenase complex dihydrolipoamide acyltransferase (E2) component